MQLEITDYTYKDTITKGSTPQKKVIAQQVAKVFRQAVTSNNIEVIPNIMQMGRINANGWIKTSQCNISTELQKGDKVKLIFENHDALVEILEIKENIFRVNQQITNHEAPVTVFIYGKQVNDFHIVDYDALSMLNVSA